MMLDARGNLDLEFPEELLTSSSTPGPRPLEPVAFERFIFALLFLMFFCIVFHHVVDGFRPPFWRHFPCLLHHFFEHRFYMDLSSTLQGILYMLCNISVHFCRPTSNWRNPQKHLCLPNLCIVYTFANTCFS